MGEGNKHVSFIPYQWLPVMLLTCDQGFLHQYVLPSDRHFFQILKKENHHQEVRKYVPANRLPRRGEFQDCYSDVYSLGVLMGQMCHHADTFLAGPIKDLLHGDVNANPSGKRIFSSYYSVQLKELIRRCRSLNSLERPSNHELYLETKSWMEAFRELSYRTEQDSRYSALAGVAMHHNKVLYTKDEQKRFDEDGGFRYIYTTANTNPVFEAEDLDAAGSERVKRKYEKLLQTMDQSIVTAIPSHVDDSDNSSCYSNLDCYPNPDGATDGANYDGSKLYSPGRPIPDAVYLSSQGPSHLGTDAEMAQEAVGPRGAEAAPRPPSTSRTRRQRIHQAMNVAKILNTAPEKE